MNVLSEVLKEITDQIASLITHIFQQSYNTGYMPTDWSKALD